MDSILENIKAFNKRFDIVDDSDYREAFNSFKTRILNSFKYIDLNVTEKSIEEFCNILAIPIEWHDRIGSDIFSTNIIDALTSEKNDQQFFYMLQVIFWLEFDGPNKKLLFATKLNMAIKLSNINLSASYKDDEVVLYPRGEKEFDQKLVNEVLSFLDTKSQKHFIDSLKFYQQNKKALYVKAAESLRHALEEFLKFKLKNKKGAKQNIAELEKKLKDGIRDPRIRNIIFQTFSYLDDYFNNNSKHQDGDIDDAEIEYLIYQTGILLRYINNSLS